MNRVRQASKAAARWVEGLHAGQILLLWVAWAILVLWLLAGRAEARGDLARLETAYSRTRRISAITGQKLAKLAQIVHGTPAEAWQWRIVVVALPLSVGLFAMTWVWFGGRQPKRQEPRL